MYENRGGRCDLSQLLVSTHLILCNKVYYLHSSWGRFIEHFVCERQTTRDERKSDREYNVITNRSSRLRTFASMRGARIRGHDVLRLNQLGSLLVRRSHDATRFSRKESKRKSSRVAAATRKRGVPALRRPIQEHTLPYHPLSPGYAPALLPRMLPVTLAYIIPAALGYNRDGRYSRLVRRGGTCLWFRGTSRRSCSRIWRWATIAQVVCTRIAQPRSRCPRRRISFSLIYQKRSIRNIQIAKYRWEEEYRLRFNAWTYSYSFENRSLQILVTRIVACNIRGL